MSENGKQTAMWRGAFGNAYVERNVAAPEAVRNNVRAFTEIIGHVADAPPQSILEVGANIGLNLRALAEISDAELYAVEPNAKARDVLVEDGVVPAGRVFDAVAGDLPLGDGAVDLAFTAGVLIHIPERDLEPAYREIHRVASRYLLSIEYFSPTPVTIPYRGETEALFKRDFGGLWLDLFDDLEPVANGFFWKRTTGLDDVNWWLFRKT